MSVAAVRYRLALRDYKKAHDKLVSFEETLENGEVFDEEELESLVEQCNRALILATEMKQALGNSDSLTEPGDNKYPVLTGYLKTDAVTFTDYETAIFNS